MTQADKLKERQRLANLINQWNDEHLDIFELSQPNEECEFHGVVRFYFQDGKNVVTKCIRVASSAVTNEVVDVLVEKFRPDMRMLTNDKYALYEVHENGEERRLLPDEKILLAQLNWGKDVREGRFLLKREGVPTINPKQDPPNFKRKLSKREKKEKKKQDKLRGKENDMSVAEKLYTDMPESKFTRSISNPDSVMKRRRQQKVEKKLQECRGQDGQGGTLKIYGETLKPDVPYKTLLLSTGDNVAYVVKEAMEKYGQDQDDPEDYCLVQVLVPPGEREWHGGQMGEERIMEDHECPLAIAMDFPPSRGTMMFQLKRRHGDQKKTIHKKLRAVSHDDLRYNREEPPPQNKLPYLIEQHPDGSDNPNGRIHRLQTELTKVGSDRQMTIHAQGPNIQAQHCMLGLSPNHDVVTITPASPESETYVNNQRIFETTTLQNGMTVRLGKLNYFRFLDPNYEERLRKGQVPPEGVNRKPGGPYGQKPQETNFDVDGKVETLHNQSPRDRPTPEELQKRHSRTPVGFSPREQDRAPQRQLDEQLPAALEFRDDKEDGFLTSVILENNSGIHFKLAPTYTIYMSVRFCLSNNYRPDMNPGDRAMRVTSFVVKVTKMVLNAIQNNCDNPATLAFWMANASEILHYFKQDHDIHPFSQDAQEMLAESVQMAFHHLVRCLQFDLQRTMPAFLDESDFVDEEDSVQALEDQRYNHGKPSLSDVLDTLTSAMNLLRRCRVNAALTIQLFSQLFHFINMWLFNILVTEQRHRFCTRSWGMRLKKRLGRVEAWAEKQGLELAADCHLCRIIQAAHLLQAPKSSENDIADISSTCFKLNSMQLRELLQRYIPEPNERPIPHNLIERVVQIAENMADDLTKNDGREVQLEEDPDLQLPFLLPEDGYSCDTVRGIPNGLAEFIEPLARAGLCRMVGQPASSGDWTVYMNSDDGQRIDDAVQRGQVPGTPTHNAEPPRVRPQLPKEPEVMTVTFNKVKGSMGLSIVAAKGEGQKERGIYIKSVVPGGAAALDGRLQAGDQLLEVDAKSLVGLTQERAAELMTRTGQTVALKVAKQGAFYHGLATLLSQPSPVMQRAASPKKPASPQISKQRPNEEGPPPYNGTSDMERPRHGPPGHRGDQRHLMNTSHSRSSPSLNKYRKGISHRDMENIYGRGSALWRIILERDLQEMKAQSDVKKQEQDLTPRPRPRSKSLSSKENNRPERNEEDVKLDLRVVQDELKKYTQQGFKPSHVKEHRMRSKSFGDLSDLTKRKHRRRDYIDENQNVQKNVNTNSQNLLRSKSSHTLGSYMYNTQNGYNTGMRSSALDNRQQRHSYVGDSIMSSSSSDNRQQRHSYVGDPRMSSSTSDNRQQRHSYVGDPRMSSSTSDNRQQRHSYVGDSRVSSSTSDNRQQRHSYVGDSRVKSSTLDNLRQQRHSYVGDSRIKSSTLDNRQQRHSYVGESGLRNTNVINRPRPKSTASMPDANNNLTDDYLNFKNSELIKNSSTPDNSQYSPTSTMSRSYGSAVFVSGLIYDKNVTTSHSSLGTGMTSQSSVGTSGSHYSSLGYSSNHSQSGDRGGYSKPSQHQARTHPMDNNRHPSNNTGPPQNPRSISESSYNHYRQQSESTFDRSHARSHNSYSSADDDSSPGSVFITRNPRSKIKMPMNQVMRDTMSDRAKATSMGNLHGVPHSQSAQERLQQRPDPRMVDPKSKSMANLRADNSFDQRDQQFPHHMKPAASVGAIQHAGAPYHHEYYNQSLDRRNDPRGHDYENHPSMDPRMQKNQPDRGFPEQNMPQRGGGPPSSRTSQSGSFRDERPHSAYYGQPDRPDIRDERPHSMEINANKIHEWQMKYGGMNDNHSPHDRSFENRDPNYVNTHSPPNSSGYVNQSDIPKMTANNEARQPNFYENTVPRQVEPQPAFHQLPRPQNEPPSHMPQKPSVAPKPAPKVMPADIPRVEVDNRQTQSHFFNNRMPDQHHSPKSPMPQSAYVPGQPHMAHVQAPGYNDPRTASLNRNKKFPSPGRETYKPPHHLSPELPPPPSDIPPELPPPPSNLDLDDDLPPLPPPPSQDYRLDHDPPYANQGEARYNMAPEGYQPYNSQPPMHYNDPRMGGGQDMGHRMVGYTEPQRHPPPQQQPPAKPHHSIQQPYQPNHDYQNISYDGRSPNRSFETPPQHSPNQNPYESYDRKPNQGLLHVAPNKTATLPANSQNYNPQDTKARVVGEISDAIRIGKDGKILKSPWDRAEKERQEKEQASEMRKLRDSEIADLESRSYLPPQDQERLRKLRLEAEFQRRLEEAEGKGEEDDDSDLDISTSSQVGREFIIQTLQEDLQKAKLRMEDYNKKRMYDDMQREQERMSSLSGRLEIFEKEREERAMRFKKRQERKMKEQEEYLKKQREIREKHKQDYDEQRRQMLAEEEKLRQKKQDEANKRKEFEAEQRRKAQEQRDAEERRLRAEARKREEEFQREQQEKRERERKEAEREIRVMEERRRLEHMSNQGFQPYANLPSQPQLQYPSDKGIPAPPTRGSSYDVTSRNNTNNIPQNNYNNNNNDSYRSMNMRNQQPEPIKPSKKSVQFNTQLETRISASYDDRHGSQSSYRSSVSSDQNTPHSPTSTGLPMNDNAFEPSSPMQNHLNKDIRYRATENMPSVIGAQEVYRDPRSRIAAQKDMHKVPSKAGQEKMSFKDKMKFFAAEAGEEQIKYKPKASKTLRNIESQLHNGN